MSEIPTEVLIELRARLLSGRTQLLGQTTNPEWVREIERRMIEAIENELRKRLH